MACENLSSCYPIVMKFSGFRILYEDTSAIDFGPDRSISLAGCASKVGRSKLDCSIELKLKGHVRLYGDCVVSILEPICLPVYKIM